MIRVVSAEFVKSATDVSHYPREPLPEFAFVGRSNVGKSSMINALSRRKKMVRVSNTPGRTKTLNFFDLGVEHGGRVKKVRLCDLPGYGFAKVSKDERAQWKAMISKYLSQRDLLRTVVSIIDAEVGPTADDVTMIDFLQEAPPMILVVATKIDRLGKSYRKPRLIEIAKKLEVPPDVVVGFSATDDIGIDEVWGRLFSSLDSRATSQ